MKENLTFGAKVIYTATGQIGTLIGKDDMGYQVRFEGDWKPFHYIPRKYLKLAEKKRKHR